MTGEMNKNLERFLNKPGTLRLEFKSGEVIEVQGVRFEEILVKSDLINWDYWTTPEQVRAWVPAMQESPGRIITDDITFIGESMWAVETPYIKSTFELDPIPVDWEAILESS